MMTIFKLTPTNNPINQSLITPNMKLLITLVAHEQAQARPVTLTETQFNILGIICLVVSCAFLAIGYYYGSQANKEESEEK